MKRKVFVIIISVIFLVIAFGIHLTQEFRFYNIESSNVFLYDWADIMSKAAQCGGISLLLSSFLTQFMGLPLVGPAIAAAIYLLSALVMNRIMSDRNKFSMMAGLAFIPAAFLFLCLENDYYMFHAHVAFLLSLLALLAYVLLPSENRKTRLAVGSMITFLLYHIAGSATVVFAVSALVVEVKKDKVRGLFALAYPAVFILSAWVYVQASILPGWEQALTPFMYYSNPSTYFFPLYAWVSVPLLILASWLLSFLDFKPKTPAVLAVAGLALAFFVAGNLYVKVHSRSYYRLIQEQHWAQEGEWDEIIRTADRRQPTFFISYLNLALAHEGMLVRNFKFYNPQDLSSLMYPTPNLKTGFTLQSAVYQSWYYHAAARQAAFDANLVTPGMCNPRQMQVLVETNIALGAFELAQKYLSKLEKTLFYRKWAQAKRFEISNPSSALLPVTDQYVRYDGLKGDMRDILDVYPTHPVLSQFYELYHIIEKEGGR